MRKMLTILVLFIGTGYAGAQRQTIDSLEALLQKSIGDSAGISIYKQLSETMAFKDFDSNLFYGQKGLALAVKKNDAQKKGAFYDNIGAAFYFNGAYDSAASYYFKAINVLQSAGDIATLGATYNNVAKLYRKTGEYVRALNFYNKAITIFQSLHDDNNLASIYNECGVVYEYQKNYDDALLYYNKSLGLKQKIKDSIGISYALSFIAGVYNEQGNFEKAENFAIKSLRIRQRANDSFAVALSHSDLGDIYQAEGAYDKASENYLASNSYIGNMIPDMRASNLQQLSNIAYRQKDYKKAFDYYSEGTALRDSIYKLASAKQVEELSTKYETAEGKRTIEEQKFEITKRNYFIAGISVLLVLAGMLGYSWYRRYRLHQQARLHAEILKQQEIATKAVISAEEAERKRIAAELHDGVGQMMVAAKMNLSSIENDIPFTTAEQKNKFAKVASLIDDSCREVRTVSRNMMPDALLKHGLAHATGEFIDKIDSKLICINFHSEGLNTRIDGNIETVLYRVIQECVNNVMRHSGAKRLDISLIKDEEGIKATIEDNGKGFNTRDKGNFDGIGLKNIQSRINYLKGTVEWDSTPGNGTLVAIYVPVT
ncbi:MAG TPA: sensor histidine kinase [Chitinophagaceae bacterium]|nr:sensor histidine kinase [Chitinophagaceae bacterium]